MVKRCFALVPAAGVSRRMGRAKLLLPVAGRALVLHTIEAWLRSEVERVIVVVRPGDEGLLAVLREAEADWHGKVEIVVPESAPPDMKVSLKAAVGHIERSYQPGLGNAFLVAPADMPGLSTAIVDRLIGEHSDSSRLEILAPTIGGERGHPVLFPWRCAAELFQLREDEGLNAIVEREEIRLVACDDLVAVSDKPFADVDTPEEYERLANGCNFNRDSTADDAKSAD